MEGDKGCFLAGCLLACLPACLPVRVGRIAAAAAAAAVSQPGGRAGRRVDRPAAWPTERPADRQAGSRKAAQRASEHRACPPQSIPYSVPCAERASEAVNGLDKTGSRSRQRQHQLLSSCLTLASHTLRNPTSAAPGRRQRTLLAIFSVHQVHMYASNGRMYSCCPPWLTSPPRRLLPTSRQMIRPALISSTVR